MKEMVEALKWPLTLVFCVALFLALFRQAIVNLIGRISRLGYGNKSVDVATDNQATAIEQQREVHAPSTGPEMVAATHAMPPANLVTADIETEIGNVLKTADYPPNVEKAWLIRTVAMLRIQHGHEVVYRLITGSQINVLLLANTPGALNMTRAREIYDAAAIAHPAIYTNFTFDTWINYPVNMGLLRLEPSSAGPNTLKITPRGEDFLHFLINNNLTAPKLG